MADSSQAHLPPGGIKPSLKLRMLGTPAPVLPGFEVDISQPLHDDERPDAVWHRRRAKAMLQAHPEIRSLFGHEPRTAIWCVLFAAAQIALAIAATSWSWWILVAVAWLVGAWININLFMLVHECNHGLVFAGRRANLSLFTLSSLPMFLSGHHTWWIEHHAHHNDLGAKKDFITRRRTFFLATRYTPPLVIPYSIFMLITQVLRSMVGLIVYVAGLLLGRLQPSDLALAVLGDEHLVSGYRRQRLTAWAVLYPLASLSMVGLLLALCGIKSVVYLLLAQAFMTGLFHPLMFGMILSNSHFHGYRHYQPSSSYYGWLNKITFNFGLHVEHHDLARVPYNRLPRLREKAPEFYDTLAPTRSYVGLAFKFLTGHRDKFNAQEHRNAVLLRSDQAA